MRRGGPSLGAPESLRVSPRAPGTALLLCLRAQVPDESTGASASGFPKPQWATPPDSCPPGPKLVLTTQPGSGGPGPSLAELELASGPDSYGTCYLAVGLQSCFFPKRTFWKELLHASSWGEPLSVSGEVRGEQINAKPQTEGSHPLLPHGLGPGRTPPFPLLGLVSEPSSAPCLGTRRPRLSADQAPRSVNSQTSETGPPPRAPSREQSGPAMGRCHRKSD